MTMIKSITVVFDIIMALIIMVPIKDLDWDNVKDRPSIIIFTFIAVLYVANIFLICL